MSENKLGNKKFIISAGALAVIIAGASFIDTGSNITVISNTQSSLEPSHLKPITVADVWQGETSNTDNNIQNPDRSENAEEKQTSYTLNYSLIHDEIGKIRLTSDGNVIADDIALKALRMAFPSSRLNHSPEMIEELLNIIKDGLPAPAGEQAADIIQKYFEYAKAHNEIASIYGDIKFNHENREEILTHTQALREQYFGEELTTQLFHQEDKKTEYMLETHEIAVNKQLTPDEKRQAQLKLKDEYVASVINQWESRYQAYEEASKSIKGNPQLKGDELKNALRNLQIEHFSIDELQTLHKANFKLR
ncbi:hypothetical protein NBRC116188_05430 [Oceaniserpentilla sp. 4NH20-0058]|uniref:lipase secretion chaperone n=1 Tax=Oceaniserpentilla sp. 4NH20-0058 TaxID=3127660 RepID=UPI00310C7F35